MNNDLHIATNITHNIPDKNDKIELIGLTKLEISEQFIKFGIDKKTAKMRAAQIYNWIYINGIFEFAKMDNISKKFRIFLAKNFVINKPKLIKEQISNDGSRKFLFRFYNSDFLSPPVDIETVYIPEQKRGTLCISSQVGCTLNCSFCHTGTQKLVRNLTASEILMQILMSKIILGDFKGRKRSQIGLVPGENYRAISNIVVMGMGEPLYNFANIKQALLIASDGDGLAISKRRITLSTSGVVPFIRKVGEEIGVMLAISLHAVRDDLRNKLVPINKKWPIKELLNACRNYPGLNNAKRITFEYVMLKGINDSDKDAKQLVHLLKNIPSKINLIPFNGWPNSPYECSDWERIKAFGDIINMAGYASPIRTPRGRDIAAACGQLKSDSERKEK